MQILKNFLTAGRDHISARRMYLVDVSNNSHLGLSTDRLQEQTFNLLWIQIIKATWATSDGA